MDAIREIIDLSMDSSEKSEVESSFDMTIDDDDPEDDRFYPNYKLLVHSNPIPKPSPSFKPFLLKLKGRKKPIVKVTTYNKKEKQMLQFRESAREQFQAQFLKQKNAEGTFPIFAEGPVCICVIFCMRPTSDYFQLCNREKPRARLWSAFQGGNLALSRKTKKPDLDNLLKFVLDALTTVAWADDRQVTEIHAYKCLDTNAPYEGRTMLEVTNKVIVPCFPWWGVWPHHPDWANGQLEKHPMSQRTFCPRMMEDWSKTSQNA